MADVTERPLRIGDAPQPPRAIRRLAKPLTPEPGEWLQTALSRWAFDTYNCSRRDLFEAIVLSNLDPIEIRGLGVALRPETADTISAATGVPFPRLLAMTQAQRDRATWSAFVEQVREGGRFPYRERDLDNVPLFREVVHKWCPDCFIERPGVHKMIWRHPWLHICLAHSRVLATRCSACGEPPRIPLGRTAQEWDPSTCPNVIRGIRCGEPFHRATPSPVNEDGLLYAAQVQIIALARSSDSQVQRQLWELPYRISRVQRLNDANLATLTGLDPNVIQRLQPRRLEEGHYVRNPEAFTVLAAAAYLSQSRHIAPELTTLPLN